MRYSGFSQCCGAGAASNRLILMRYRLGPLGLTCAVFIFKNNMISNTSGCGYQYAYKNSYLHTKCENKRKNWFYIYSSNIFVNCKIGLDAKYSSVVDAGTRAE
jgi:hypothetical protein